MDCSCTIKNIINKGVHAIIRARGGLLYGKQYTCCLYYKAQVEEFRAEQTAEAYLEDGVVYCLFNFAPEQTAELKAVQLLGWRYTTRRARIVCILMMSSRSYAQHL